VLTVLGSLAIGWSSPGTAEAHDHLVPKVDLRIGGLVQKGGVDFITWSDQVGPNQCSTLQIEGSGEFPAATPVGLVAQSAAIRFRKRQRPRDVQISAWEATPGQPAPEPESIAFTLERGRGSIRVWRAVFDAEPGRHYYLVVSASWRDETGCAPQQIVKTFHLGP
jgi:hypothetical protein